MLVKNTATVKTLTCKRINVLGFLSKKGILKSFIAEGRVNSDKLFLVFNSYWLLINKSKKKNWTHKFKNQKA